MLFVVNTEAHVFYWQQYAPVIEQNDVPTLIYSMLCAVQLTLLSILNGMLPSTSCFLRILKKNTAC